MALTIFDLVVFSIIIISIISGLYRGLIALSIGFIASICSILFAYFLYPFMREVFLKFFSHYMVVNILSGISSYLLSLMLLSFISGNLLTMLKEQRGGVIDRFLGAFGGFVRGALVSAAIFFAAQSISCKAYNGAGSLYDVTSNMGNCESPKWLAGGASFEFLAKITNLIMQSIPEESLKSISFNKAPWDDKDVDDNSKEEETDSNADDGAISDKLQDFKELSPKIPDLKTDDQSLDNLEPKEEGQ